MNLDAAQLEGLADSLVDSHDKLMEELVKMRKKHRLTQDVVAERMGVSQPTVAAFERYDANPTLSTIRRYALAVGASIRHEVEDRCCAFDEGTVAFISRVLHTPVLPNWTSPREEAPDAHRPVTPRHTRWGTWTEAKRTDFALA